jgi:hypothetical protein
LGLNVVGMTTVHIQGILRRLFERAKHKARTVAGSGFCVGIG